MDELQRQINEVKANLDRHDKLLNGFDATVELTDVIRNSVVDGVSVQDPTSPVTSIKRTITVVTAGGSGTTDVLRYPDGFLNLMYKDKRYSIPFYNNPI